jgi:DNA polymerase III subunit beta
MKFSASQSSLLAGLQPLAAVVPTKSPMPVLTQFLAQLSGNILTVTATDLEISMETQIEVKGAKDGRALLPARKFLEEIRVFPDVMISVEATENGRIKLVAEDKNYDLSAESVQNYPKVPAVEEKDVFKMDRAKLRRMIEKTIFAVSRDELRPQLTGEYLKFMPGEIRLVTTDGHRLVKMTIKQDEYKGEARECIVPAKAMSTVARMCAAGEGDVQILFAANQIAFRVGNTTLISKLIEGRYPNYEAVIPADNKNALTVDCDQFHKAVLRASIVSNEISRQIRLKLRNDHLQILVEDIEQGNEGQETVPCTFNGEAMDIGYNAAYVIDVLKQIDTPEVVFELGSPTSAGIVKPSEQEKDEDLLMLVMPVRLN